MRARLANFEDRSEQGINRCRRRWRNDVAGAQVLPEFRRGENGEDRQEQRPRDEIDLAERLQPLRKRYNQMSGPKGERSRAINSKLSLSILRSTPRSGKNFTGNESSVRMKTR